MRLFCVVVAIATLAPSSAVLARAKRRQSSAGALNCYEERAGSWRAEFANRTVDAGTLRLKYRVPALITGMITGDSYRVCVLDGLITAGRKALEKQPDAKAVSIDLFTTFATEDKFGNKVGTKDTTIAAVEIVADDLKKVNVPRLQRKLVLGGSGSFIEAIEALLSKRTYNPDFIR